MLRESRDIGARRKRCFQVLRFSGVVSDDQEEAVCKEIFRCRLSPLGLVGLVFIGLFGDSRFVCVKGVWDPPLLRF